MHPRHKITHKPGTEARKHQQWQHLRENHIEGLPESQSCHRLDQGHDQRHKHSGKYIDQYYICRDPWHIASQLSRHHRSCSCRRTDQAQHRAFHKNLPVIFPSGKHFYEKNGTESQNCKQTSLYHQKPPMPSVRFQFTRFYPAEGQEQHSEYQQGLKHSDKVVQERPCLMHRCRQCIIYKIKRCSRQHSDRKHPVFYCLF